MNIKSLKVLRICVLLMGWLLLIGVLTGIWVSYLLYYDYHLHYHAPEFVTQIAQFSILKSLSSFFSGFGSVFFAFLVAAVFRMIEKNAPVGKERAQRLMIVCCLSYLADAIVRFCSFISDLSVVVNFFSLSDWTSLPYIARVVPFAPVLYAASIFVLFTHFTKMVTFESEVA
jgi:membrane-anchored glycerophosphoryl diester phosphodiesterase (GDPDase)